MGLPAGSVMGIRKRLQYSGVGALGSVLRENSEGRVWLGERRWHWEWWKGLVKEAELP